MIFGIIKNFFLFLVFQPTTFILWWFYSATKNFINFFIWKNNLSVELIESPQFIIIFTQEKFHNAKEPANNKKELSSHNMWKIEVETIEDPLARGSLWSASNTNLMILIPHLRFTWIGRFKHFFTLSSLVLH